MTKTNAMRMLDNAHINYTVKTYTLSDKEFSGQKAAEQLSMPQQQVFKTLVAKGDKSGICIFCLPVSSKLNLKKSAAVSGNKRLEMVAAKDVLSVAGYAVGACSPVGMKRQFPTFIDKSATAFDTIGVSAGAKGCEINICPVTLCNFVRGRFCDISDNI